MKIHEKKIRSGFQSDVMVDNTLVDMSAKCGSIEKACNLFDKMMTAIMLQSNSKTSLEDEPS